MSESVFNCTSCGLCCKKLTKELLEELHLPEHKDGGCAYLTEDNKCSIYSSRPEICNVRLLYERYKVYITLENFYKINEAACKQLQDDDAKQKSTNK